MLQIFKYYSRETFHITNGEQPSSHSRLSLVHRIIDGLTVSRSQIQRFTFVCIGWLGPRT